MTGDDGHAVLMAYLRGTTPRGMPIRRKYPRRVDPASLPDIAFRLRVLHRTVAKERPELGTQADFAESIGMRRNHFANCLTGKARIGVDAALRIWLKFHVPLEWLYTGNRDFVPTRLMDRLDETTKELIAYANVS